MNRLTAIEARRLAEIWQEYDSLDINQILERIKTAATAGKISIELPNLTTGKMHILCNLGYLIKTTDMGSHIIYW